MELKKIELTGFKSFAKKTVFEIGFPVTGIVGPNGSGKSNVAEAFRFVLGEQSVKSMRGKTGADLIFKGSKFLSPLSRASVTLTFLNTQTRSTDEKYASFDEIVISREIFADGTNDYSLNGTKVRLKDIQELLAHSNVGASHHHIISQGEADRVLHASSKERKEMIQDALGLRVYEWRLRDSEKKLEKVLDNMREAQISRREIAPHLAYLKKQIEKVNKGTELRSQLAALYHVYLAQEEQVIHIMMDAQPHTLKEIEKTMQDLEVQIASLKRTTQNVPDDLRVALVQAERAHAETETQKNNLIRTLATLNAEVSFLERSLQEDTVTETVTEDAIPQARVRDFVSSVQEIQKQLAWRIEHAEYQELPQLITLLKARLQSFEVELNSKHVIHTKNSSDKEGKTKARLQIVSVQIQTVTKEDSLLQQKIKDTEHARVSARATIDAYKDSRMDDERKVFELERSLTEKRGEHTVLMMKQNELYVRKDRFEQELEEGKILIGSGIMQYKSTTLVPDEAHTQDDRRKQIERLKLRIDDIGVVQVEEVSREFEAVQGRDSFLHTELEDLEKSKVSLENIMLELRTTLESEFTRGLVTINGHFATYFATMFGGGEASLALIEREKKARKSDEEESDEEKEIEQGIEVAVSLPHKKVKDINMLSGGERALTSIALLFAMSQVNPPPFLILDETDAALDEANAKKYGAVLHELAVRSKLIVITHNRETMSRAHGLYGVTLDKDGSSRILSVKLDEANVYAK